MLLNGKLLTLVSLVVAVTAGIAAADPTRITIDGEAALNGIFDPSLESAPGASEGWLAYSAVFGDLTPYGPHVEGRLAKTTDSGASFSQHSVINASQFATLTLPDESTLDGVWNYETSSLVYDPDDPGAEWKHYSHRIFRTIEDNTTSNQNQAAYSWIVSRTAPDPSGPWSPEIALFSSGPLPPAPYDNVQVSVNSLDPSLASMLVYSEPGAFYRDGVLYMSLTGLIASPERIILLASDDHGATWRFVSTLLTQADATALGFLSFDGSAIAAEGFRVFLLVTPESPGILHDGTLVIEFDEIATGALVRDEGTPVIAKHLPALPGLPADRRGGQADFHTSFITGIVMPSLQLDDFPEFFQFFATGEALIEPIPLPSLGVPAGLLSIASFIVLARLAARTDSKRSGTREARY